MENTENVRAQRDAMICYRALYLIELMSGEERSFFNSNRVLKNWMGQSKAAATEQTARHAFWLLNINHFIKRENRSIVVTEHGQEFLKTPPEQRVAMLKLHLDEKDFKDFKKNPRHIGMTVELSGKGWRRINYRNLQKKSTQSGWISEFLKLCFPDKLNSASFALMRAEEPGAVHEHSKTEEIFIFTGGYGYMEIGEKKSQVPVDRKYLVVVGADTPHKVIPVFRKNKGRFLDMIVVSLPGWESENEYKIGESHPSLSGPSD